MTTILLTGAAGYIASHTWLALQAAGYRVVGVDNFANSSPVVLERLNELAAAAIEFERADVCDAAAMDAVFSRHRPEAVVHFAAHKAVGESVSQPLAYYRNNLGGLVNTCEVMQRHGCKRMVFSSSATVYGAPDTLPLREDAPTSATNPYGATKLMGEQILRDLGVADPAWQTACLRYFNPVGAHESGRIGEDPRGTPNNLMPYVAQVAVGRREKLSVFGNDYPTPDGTGVLSHAGSLTVNLGTGTGYSVLDLVRAYEAASGRPVPYEIVPRRPGDVAACWADPALARDLLGWEARLDLARMCADSWRWQHHNPQGFN
jgi:UDP-glucose 4-epimerase